jgi:hypothetical protein
MRTIKKIQLYTITIIAGKYRQTINIKGYQKAINEAREIKRLYKPADKITIKGCRDGYTEDI